ncbi:hypothetical protein [Streptomyces chartreusis]|uniref:hypothetical protein n=1 Tax=Streptomyces chartreusis TaxID=1969 RepID=UPI0033B4A411
MARSLNTPLSSAGGDSARSMLVSVTNEGNASVIRCGHPPPLLVSEATAQPLNIMTSPPPLGHFARTGPDLPRSTRPPYASHRDAACCWSRTRPQRKTPVTSWCRRWPSGSAPTPARASAR